LDPRGKKEEKGQSAPSKLVRGGTPTIGSSPTFWTKREGAGGGLALHRKPNPIHEEREKSSIYQPVCILVFTSKHSRH